MGLMQRNKGKRFERAIATVLRSYFPDAVVRRASQADRAYQSDVYIAGGPPLLSQLWLECQDAAAPTPIAKLKQAERDVGLASIHEMGEPRFPIVIWHKLGARDIHATMRIHTLDVIRKAIYESQSDAVWGTVVTLTIEDLLTLVLDTVTEQAKEPAA